MTSNSKISVQVIKPGLLSLDALRGFDMFWIVGGLVNVSSTSMSLFGWIAKPLSEDANHLIIVLGNIVLSWLLLYFMYRKKLYKIIIADQDQ